MVISSVRDGYLQTRRYFFCTREEAMDNYIEELGDERPDTESYTDG